MWRARTGKMRKAKRCKEDGCLRFEHACGWCSCHYNEHWRYGEIRPPERRHARRETPINDAANSAERTLADLLDIYQRAVGWRRRLELWRKIELAKKELERLRVHA